MGKYIDAERLKAEIKRLKHQAKESKMEWVNEGYNQNAFAEDCRITSFNKLLSFLDTLEPVTDCNDFDSLFDEFCDAHPDGMTLEECGRFFFSRGFSRGKMVATNDFDLALAQRYLTGYYDGKYEPVSDDLEDEMDRYFESMEVQEHENIFEDTFHRIAKHFAEWGAEHLADRNP